MKTVQVFDGLSTVVYTVPDEMTEDSVLKGRWEYNSALPNEERQKHWVNIHEYILMNGGRFASEEFWDLSDRGER